MRSRYFSLALLLCSLSCFGQAFTPMRPFIMQSALDENLAHLYLWWNSDDLLATQVDLKVAEWKDRIQGWLFTNEVVATRPINRISGVEFNNLSVSVTDATTSFLTNVVSVDTPYSLIFMVLEWEKIAGQINIPFLEYIAGVDQNFQQFNLNLAWSVQGGVNCGAVGNTVDTNLLMTICSANTQLGGYHYYTNGVASYQAACGYGRFNRVGAFPGYWAFKGKIRDIIVYTNVEPSVLVPYLQNYAHTNYGVPLWP